MSTASAIHNTDRRISVLLNRLCSISPLRIILATVSRLGDGVCWYVLLAVLPLLNGYQGLLVSVQMALTGLVATCLYKSLKKATRRLRPCERYPHIKAFTAPIDKFSFPSGHTLHAVSFSLIIIHYYPVWTAFFLSFSFLIALARVVLGHHYLSDVLAGLVIGGSLALLSLTLYQAF